jgi:glutamyl-tRNA reductase
MNGAAEAAPSITLVGVNHRSAPIALRERLTYTEEEIPATLQALSASAAEAYLLCTCNRTELYTVSEQPDTGTWLPDFLAHSRRVPRGDLEGHYYVRAGDEAVRHLLHVAAGLDSLVLGEAQILGQVGDAFKAASAAGTVGRVLGRLLPLALEVGKRARAQTRIGQGFVSISSAAVDLARTALGDLHACRVLVIGAGDAGQATARSLADAGVAEIVVANRSLQRAEEIAMAVGGRAIPQSEILPALESVDIVISSTGASEYLVSAAEVAPRMTCRQSRHLLCIDIAVPRDLDPRLAEIPGVLLYNVDDLKAVTAANLEDRQREVAAVNAIIDEGVEDFLAWRTVQQVVPTIGALYRRAEAIRRTEVDRTLRRLGTLSPDELNIIDAMTSSIVRRILHDPVTTLRARGADPEVRDLARSMQELFRLPADEPETQGPPW